MYLLLIGIHSIFIITCQIFWYYLLEALFIILLLFFLLYFSPIFFLKKEVKLSSFQIPSFSPQKSIAIPMILVYTALYLFLFALTGSIESTLSLHLYILIGVHIIFFGYMMSFVWKHDIFFDIARFHLVFAYGTVIGAAVLWWFDKSFFSLPLLFLAILNLGLSGIIFSVSREEHPILFQSFLTEGIFSLYLLFFLITKIYSFPLFIACIWIISVILFEFMPKYRFFIQFLEPSKIFTLSLSIISLITLLGWSFYDFTTLYPVVVLCIFFFSVHIRYSNYITFWLAIFSLLFVYSRVFSGMIDGSTFISTMLFIFFLPLIIVGTTYFWKEKYLYDFAMLHYSSIAFSIIFSLYSIFFVWWGALILYVVSSCIFLLGVLFFLSYFRFRYH